MTPAIIFGTLNFATSVAGYFGLIESVRGNVQKLLHQSFKSAVQNLKYAVSASGDNRMDYLRTARERFIDAISVEENENLISALVGLAMCQHFLGDEENATKTLARIEEVSLSLPEKALAMSKTVLKLTTLGYLYSAYKLYNKQNPLTDDLNDRVLRFEEYKGRALAIR